MANSIIFSFADQKIFGKAHKFLRPSTIVFIAPTKIHIALTNLKVIFPVAQVIHVSLLYITVMSGALGEP